MNGLIILNAINESSLVGCFARKKSRTAFVMGFSVIDINRIQMVNKNVLLMHALF